MEIRPGKKPSAGRIVTAVIRVLLGLMFLVFGLNGFLNFMPAPKDLPPDVITVSTGLMKGGYMAVVSATELVVAFLVMELYLAWAYRGAFRTILRAKVSPSPNSTQ
jgi:hypothetical protein